MPTRSPSFVSDRLLATALAAAAVLVGCRPTPSAGPKSQHGLGPLEALALLPEQTQIVLSADLGRLRAQPAWKALSSAAARNARPFLDAIAAGTGIDPIEQVGRIWVGLPGTRQSDGRFVLLAETDQTGPARIKTWQKTRPASDMTVLLPGPGQILISRGAWASEAVRATRTARSAADNPELRRLCERAAGRHGIWFAALVPIEIRKSLMGESHLADTAALTRVFGFLDDTSGLHLELVGEFANTSAPPLLAHRLRVLHNQARRDPDMLVAGLSPYLEALRVDAEGASVRARLELSDAQADAVLEAIESLALITRTKYSRAP